MSGCSHETVVTDDAGTHCADCGVPGEFVSIDDIRLTLRELAARLKIIEAIYIKGPAPELHDATMARHRAEWPSLWTAIDALLATTTEGEPR